MSLTYRDRLHLAPPARRARVLGARLPPPDGDDHGIGRSPKSAPGWWLTGAAICYVAIAIFCILVL